MKSEDLFSFLEISRKKTKRTDPSLHTGRTALNRNECKGSGSPFRTFSPLTAFPCINRLRRSTFTWVCVLFERHEMDLGAVYFWIVDVRIEHVVSIHVKDIRKYGKK